MLDPDLQRKAEAGHPDAQLQLGVSLLEQGRAGSESFEQGVAWLERAAQHNPAARVMLGHAFVQAHHLPEAYATAVAHYQAAAQGPAPHCLEAQARLADLAMIGLGQPQDDRQALALYQQVADAHQADARCDVAYMQRHGLGCQPNAQAAFASLLQAAAQGSPRAYFDLAVCLRDGLGADANSALASALFSNAAMGSYPLAEAMRHQLWGQLKTSDKELSQQWAEAITHNRRDLGRVLGSQISEQQLQSGDPAVLAELRQLSDAHFASLGIDSLSLDPARRGPGTSAPQRPLPQLQCWRPRVLSMDEFISDDERAHLITIGQHNMLTAEQTASATHLTERDAFNGDSAIIGLPLCDPLTRNIQRRIAEAVMIPIEHHEPLSILRYGPGHEYAPHVDYFTEEREALNASRQDIGGQRVVTFLIHLVTPEQGGETEYVRAGVRIDGAPRRASIHFNTLPSGEADLMSLHAGLPIVSGEKWLCRTAIRANPLVHSPQDEQSSSSNQADAVRLRGDGLEQS